MRFIILGHLYLYFPSPPHPPGTKTTGNYESKDRGLRGNKTPQHAALSCAQIQKVFYNFFNLECVTKTRIIQDLPNIKFKLVNKKQPNSCCQDFRAATTVITDSTTMPSSVYPNVPVHPVIVLNHNGPKRQKMKLSNVSMNYSRVV